MSTEARRELQEKERAVRAEKRCRVAVCGAAGCQSNGGQAVREAFDRTVKEAGAEGQAVEVFGTGCLGLCDAGPLVQVESDEGTRLYEKVDASTAVRIATEDAIKGTPAKDLLDDANAAFFAKQRKIVLENSGPHRPRADRVVRRRGRLRGAAEGRHRDDAARRHPADHGLGPAGHEAAAATRRG